MEINSERKNRRNVFFLGVGKES